MPLNDEREKQCVIHKPPTATSQMRAPKMLSSTSAESTHSQPSQTERNALAADRARIAVIKAKIMELERSLASLNEERDLLQERIDGYAYPVLTLPNEVVSEIFVHFLPIYPNAPPILGRKSPNVLGETCHHWREIALSTPMLWRAISLSLRNGMRLHHKLRLLDTWLQRSGSCLLSINIDLGDDHGDDEGIPVLFIRTIAVHSARWEHLRLYSESAASHFPSITTPLPFLRTLSMSARQHGVMAAHNTESLNFAFHTAPLLRNVAVAFWGEHSIFLYPWSQLTAFTGHLIWPRHCVDILTQALNLVYCKFYIDSLREEPQISPLNMVTLPYLQTFILNGDPSNTYGNILRMLTLPALQKLQVAEHLLQGDPVETLKSLFSRSKCSVRELYVIDEPQSSDLYRLAFPTVGSIIFDSELYVVNPWFVPREDQPLDDEESPS
ncbi:hypothetical protein C8F04DRAFT_1042279 [Mycena alexandri]|uniref:F-box domain-containing protein n=1 Tax=Mycena alexandri TaxID=1745969 RepID=A0AAD6SNT7_9AGAR|nr:hypothetical protein C8F04DRAFT_1042279 [Mycena alexandri]